MRGNNREAEHVSWCPREWDVPRVHLGSSGKVLVLQKPGYSDQKHQKSAFEGQIKRKISHFGAIYGVQWHKWKIVSDVWHSVPSAIPHEGAVSTVNFKILQHFAPKNMFLHLFVTLDPCFLLWSYRITPRSDARKRFHTFSAPSAINGTT